MRESLAMRYGAAQGARHPGKLLLCVACTAGVALSATWATVAWAAIEPLSLEKVAREAEQIVVGKVTAVSAGYLAVWPRVGKLIFTDVTLHVEDRWKGESIKESITLQVPGGTIEDGRRMIVSDAPIFTAGERVLVFCAPRNGRLWVYGWDQGKYSIVRERVVGKANHPIGEDILTDPLRRKVLEILQKKGN